MKILLDIPDEFISPAAQTFAFDPKRGLSESEWIAANLVNAIRNAAKQGQIKAQSQIISEAMAAKEVLNPMTAQVVTDTISVSPAETSSLI